MPHEPIEKGSAKAWLVYAGARLDDPLFVYLLDPVTREQLRAVLVKTYFAPQIQPVVFKQGFVNQAAYDYAQKIIAGLKETQESFATAPP